MTTSYFGFIPSEILDQDIQLAKASRNSTEPTYPLRDRLCLQVNEEGVDHLLNQLIAGFPHSENKETAIKLAGYLKSTIIVLLKQLLGKTPNDKVIASLDYLENSLFVSPTDANVYRIGVPIDPALVRKLKASFAEVAAGNIDAQRPILLEAFLEFSDEIIDYFIIGFLGTLDLGVIKRKAVSITAAALRKALKIGLNKLIPKIVPGELSAVAAYYDQLIFIEE